MRTLAVYNSIEQPQEELSAVQMRPANARVSLLILL